MKTRISKTLRLSESQIEVLLKGVDHMLSRSSMGWSYDDRVRHEDGVRIHSPATIKSLWKRGLLDSNFVDPRAVGRCDELDGVQNLDGEREFLVWTSELGRKALDDIQQKLLEDIGSQVLEDFGLLPDQSEIVYH
jgi:hypothetical protein